MTSEPVASCMRIFIKEIQGKKKELDNVLVPHTVGPLVCCMQLYSLLVLEY